MWPPSPFSALPPVISYEASPKAISRRTSYLRVRLEFLRYPQLIPAFFNRRLVRASMNFYVHFTLAMDRSPGFGSTSCNFSPSSDSLSLRLRPSQALTSLHNVTRRSVLQKVQGRTLYRAPSACKHRVSGSFSLPSRGPFHLSLTVLFAIGHQVVFSLGGWAPLLPAGFLVSCGTLVPAAAFSFSLTRLLRSLAPLSNGVQLTISSASAGPQPRKACSPVWALSASLAATSEIDLSFSSSGYLDVSVPRVPSRQTIFSSAGDKSSTCRVSPFGYQGISACLRLPLAFRSLPRPSSALGALASTLCSSSLDYFPETRYNSSGQI